MAAYGEIPMAAVTFGGNAPQKVERLAIFAAAQPV